MEKKVKVIIELDGNSTTQGEVLVKGELDKYETFKEFKDRVDYTLRKLETLYNL